MGRSKRVTESKSVLDFSGVESYSLDIYHDILGGVYTCEIKDEYTRSEVSRAIVTIQALLATLHANDLVG